MRRSIPYIRDHELFGVMDRDGVLPKRTFCLKPENYRVVDGDTIAVTESRAGNTPGRVAFRIRFSNVNAPEMPALGHDYYSMLKHGVNIHSGNYGMEAKLRLQEICKGRALFVCPGQLGDDFGMDHHKRLLADVCVSGGKGPLFEPIGAKSLQHIMLQENHVRILDGYVMPDEVPHELSVIEREFRMTAELNNTQDSLSPGF